MNNTTDTASHAFVATAVTVWGVATGLSYEVLLAGFAGGLVSLSFLNPMPIWRRIWTLVTATLTAGYTGPFIAYYINKAAPPSGELMSLVFAGFVIGLSTELLIPAAMEASRRRVEQLGGRA